MRELPAGRDALLLDFSDEDVPWRSALDVVRRLRAAMAAGELTAITDVVPADATVLVQATPGGGLDHLGLRRALRGRRAAPEAEPSIPVSVTGDPVVIDVRYDGPDLAAVADLAGLSVEQVVAAHTDTTWRVQFMGFAPGFGYLVPHDGDLDRGRSDALAALRTVPRRSESRPSVPAGSVAMAAGYTAVYPRSSPGGWHLVGHCDIDLWDIDLWDVRADPPARLTPGRLVRFVSA